MKNKEILQAVQAARRGTFYLCWTGEVVAMRSQLETRYAACLDRMGIPWVYEPAAYETEGAERYVPDFLVGLPEGSTLVEVKRSASPSLLRKFEAFRQRYPRTAIKLVGPREIRELEVRCAGPEEVLVRLVIWARTAEGRGRVPTVEVTRAADRSSVQSLLHQAYLRRRKREEVGRWP